MRTSVNTFPFYVFKRHISFLQGSSKSGFFFPRDVVRLQGPCNIYALECHLFGYMNVKINTDSYKNP